MHGGQEEREKSPSVLQQLGEVSLGFMAQTLPVGGQTGPLQQPGFGREGWSLQRVKGRRLTPSQPAEANPP